MPQLPSTPDENPSRSTAPSAPPHDAGEGKRGRVFVIGLLVVLGGTLAWTAIKGLFPSQATPANRAELLAEHSKESAKRTASTTGMGNSSPASPETSATATAATPDGNAPITVTRAPESAVELAAALAEVEAFLRGKHSANEIARMLEQFRARLMHGQPGAALQVMSDYLGSGRDLSTTLDFNVGKGGWLDSAPTLRVFMLDTLGEVDPAAGAAYAKTILDQPPGSADEWALSLRNLTQHDDAMAADPYLANKTRELISNPAWLNNPSLGFLEAFDFVVFTKQTDLAPQMASYLENTDYDQGLRYASYVALDRLVIANPASVLPIMEANPHMLDTRPAVRASEFARADVTDPVQLAAVENYLLRTDLSTFEISQFMDGFPWHAQGVGNNLATVSAMPNLQQMAVQDAASLAAVDQWLADPRFASLQADLQKLRADLVRVIKSDQQGGLLPESGAEATVTLK